MTPGGRGREGAAGGGKGADGSCAPTAPSRLLPPLTAHAASIVTSTPGTMLASMTVRTSAPRLRTTQATSGPITAPTWSSPRCNPNARPTIGAGVTSAINASRGGVRRPLPSRSTTRRATTCHAAAVSAMTGRTAAARNYPPTISGPRRDARSASRPETSFTSAAAASAAPSSAPNATAPPPRTPVMNAGSSGYTISLAKSLRRETAPNSLTCLGSCWRSLTQAESPADQRDGQAAVREHGVVEGAQREAVALRLAEVVAQPEQLAPSDCIAQLVRRPRAVAPHFGLGVAALDVELVHHLIDCLLARHAARVQADVEQDTHRAPQQMHALEKELLVRGVKPFLTHHVFAVECPSFDRKRRPEILAHVRRQLFRDDELQMMPGIAFVQRRGGQLVAAVIAENPLLLLPRQARIGDGDIEPAGAVTAVGPRTVVRGVRNHRAHERGRRNHPQRCRGNGRELPLLYKITSAGHFPGVRVHQLARRRVIATQLVDELRPRLAAVQPLGEAHQIGLDLLFKPQAVAPQLRRRIAERVLIVQQEVERLLADREVLRPHFQPALEVGVEREQRRARLLRRGRETGGMHRCLRAERGRELFDEQPAAFGHSHRGLDEDANRLFQRGLEILEEFGDVLESSDRRGCLLGGRAVGGEEQVMQAAEQMREPEFGILGLGFQLLEAAQHDADFVQ